MRKQRALFVLAGLVWIALLLLAVGWMHEALSRPGVMGVDRDVQEAVHRRATDGLTVLAKTLSFVGSPETLFPVVTLVASTLWARERRREGILLASTVAGAGLIERAIKMYFRRPRPGVPWAYVQEHSFSFPSGHATLAVALYGVICYLAWKTGWRLGLAAMGVIMVAGIGLSRIYLGAHFPTDVATGYGIGAWWVATVVVMDRISSGVRRGKRETGSGCGG